mmetsp:Transcript_3683/g.9205  ORF Transcript_3683/g.9205 Transcript_3683/m.9205 type:complete len:106 (-) Transcript_3683:227-544(-)
MHDSVRLEAAGVPSVGIYSSAFTRQARFQAEKLGLTSAARVFVPHPISDQTPEQLTAKAAAVFDEVTQALTDASFENGEAGCDDECAKPCGAGAAPAPAQEEVGS